MKNEISSKTFQINGQAVECQIMFRRKIIQGRVKQLAKEIANVYAGTTLLLVTVLNGGKPFADDLLLALFRIGNINIIRESIQVSSYSGTKSSEQLTWKKDFSGNYVGKGISILLVEDIIDSGYTMTAIKKELRQRFIGTDIKCVSLFNKPACRLPEYSNLEVDFVGFVLDGSPFLIGYGLDLDNDKRTRNLRDIYAVSE